MISTLTVYECPDCGAALIRADTHKEWHVRRGEPEPDIHTSMWSGSRYEVVVGGSGY